MIGYLVSGAFVSVFWYPHIWVLSGLAMGLNTATVSTAVSAPQMDFSLPQVPPACRA
jgi:hypothetical protein